VHFLESDNSYSVGIQKSPGKADALILGTDGSESDGIIEMPANKTESLMEAGKIGIAAL